MFSTKIRGIPLRQLVKSGLFPQINVLRSAWRNKHSVQDPVAQIAARNRLLWSVAWFGLVGCGMILIMTSATNRFPVFAIIGFVFVMIVYMTTLHTVSIRKFIRSVRHLDTVLKKVGPPGGIAVLPREQSQILLFFKDLAGLSIKRIVACEHTFGKMSEEAERARQQLKKYALAVETSGFDLGPYDEEFKKAEELCATDLLLKNK